MFPCTYVHSSAHISGRCTSDSLLCTFIELISSCRGGEGGRGEEERGGEGRRRERVHTKASQCASKLWVEEEGQCVEGAAVPSQAARGAGAVEAASSHPASDRLRVARELEPHTSCHGIRVLSPLSLSPAFHFHKHCFPTIASVVRKKLLASLEKPTGVVVPPVREAVVGSLWCTYNTNTHNRRNTSTADSRKQTYQHR